MFPQCVLISPTRDAEKHPTNPLSLRQRFLNFGALSIASHLAKNGISALVIDEYTLPRRDSIDDFLGRSGNQQPLLVGVSSISAYSSEKAQSILRRVKSLWPGVPLVIGGQHFAGYWGESFSKHMPEADMLVSGEAEAAVCDILNTLIGGKTLGSLQPSDLPTNVYWQLGRKTHRGSRPASMRLLVDDLVEVDYTLYPGSDRLFPSIEFSRGCPYACVFCANSAENRLGYRRASAASIGAAVSRLVKTRRDRPVQFYMQASNFAATKAEADALKSAISSANDTVQWRTEVRVDGMEQGAVAALSECGLRVLDLGLESASHNTLRIMRKTTNPTEYLARANSVLREASDAGVFTKVNFLIHPGDTEATVMESWDWLKSRSHLIGGVSSGVALEYPGTPLSRDFARYEVEFGAKRLPHPLSHWGVNFMQPSRELSLQRAETLATQIAQSMQTREQFAKSKSFGYLGVVDSFEDLIETLPEADHSTPYRK